MLSRVWLSQSFFGVLHILYVCYIFVVVVREDRLVRIGFAYLLFIINIGMKNR